MQKNINNIKQSLKGLYPETEITSFINWIMFHVLGYNTTQIMLNRNMVLEDHVSLQIKAIIERLKKYEPIQYIVGATEFCGLTLSVAPGVLIPRPETEELVERIVKSGVIPGQKILDIGTGSGCIAFGLKNYFPDSHVWACDISENALEIAKRNSIETRLDVDFFLYDILNQIGDLPNTFFDVIVSNPPYVLQNEMAAMERNVIGFEPHLALFVPDNDPLLFYSAITSFASEKLNIGGKLWFEVNENKGTDVCKLLLSYGFIEVEELKDIFGKIRYVKGVRD